MRTVLVATSQIRYTAVPCLTRLISALYFIILIIIYFMSLSFLLMEHGVIALNAVDAGVHGCANIVNLLVPRHKLFVAR